MPHSKEFLSYSSSFLSTSGLQNQQVQDRLALYQVFLRVYEQNRDLLNGILELEHSGNRLISATTLTYVQGVIVGNVVYLVTNLTAGKTEVISHPDAYWTIGRDRRSCTLPIADRRLSRRHAAITYVADQQQFQLVDLKSTNGTFVNEEQIVKPQHLQDGDRIRLGGVSFTFFFYEIPIQLEPDLLLNTGNTKPTVAPSVEGYNTTAGLEPDQERRKSLNDQCAEDTMMVLRPTRLPNS